MVSSIELSLPSTVWLTINTNDLKVVTLVEYITKTDINHHQLSRLHPS